MSLITISKPGEGKLRILLEHLEEHVRLGWQRIEDEIEEAVAEITGDADKAAKDSAAKGGHKKAASEQKAD